jgi:hypothetical protein
MKTKTAQTLILIGIILLAILLLFTVPVGATPPGHLPRCMTNPHFDVCNFIPVVIK